MAPNKRPNSAPRMMARSVNSLMFLSLGTNGRNSPGGAVELHGRSLKKSLPGTEQATDQIGSVRDYAAGGPRGEANLGAERSGNGGNSRPPGLLTSPGPSYIVRGNTVT